MILARNAYRRFLLKTLPLKSQCQISSFQINLYFYMFDNYYASGSETCSQETNTHRLIFLWALLLAWQQNSQKSCTLTEVQHNPKLSLCDGNFWETLSQKPLPETYSQRMWKVSSSRLHFLHLESVATPFKVRCLPNGVLPCQQASHQSDWSLFTGRATVWCQWVLYKADYLRVFSAAKMFFTFAFIYC